MPLVLALNTVSPPVDRKFCCISEDLEYLSTWTNVIDVKLCLDLVSEKFALFL